MRFQVSFALFNYNNYQTKLSSMNKNELPQMYYPVFFSERKDQKLLVQINRKEISYSCQIKIDSTW